MIQLWFSIQLVSWIEKRKLILDTIKKSSQPMASNPNCTQTIQRNQSRTVLIGQIQTSHTSERHGTEQNIGTVDQQRPFIEQ